jgi:hypothetical protein
MIVKKPQEGLLASLLLQRQLLTRIMEQQRARAIARLPVERRPTLEERLRADLRVGVSER